MNRISLSFPELGFVVVTRAILGVGIGLLLAGRLGDRRKSVGAALAIVGALTTIPALIAIRGSARRRFLFRVA